MNTLRLLALGLLLLARATPPAAAQALDPTFTAPLSLYTTGQVYYLGPQQADGKRVVGGYFTRVNGAATGANFVRLDAAGAVDATFAQNVGAVSGVSQVLSLPTGQYLLAGGGSIIAGGISRNELLRLNANGTADATFSAGTGAALNGSYGYGQLYAVQPDGKIIVAGNFDHYNGVAAAGVVRLNANGSVDPAFNVGTGFDLNTAFPASVAVQADGKILLGGEFDTFNGQAAGGLVRLNATGSVDGSFSSPLLAFSYVEGLVMQPDGKILANGFLNLPSSTSRYAGLMRLLPNGTLDPNFVTSNFLDGDVSTNTAEPAVLLQPDGKIIVSGYFTGAVGNRVARLNADGTSDVTFQVGTGPNTAPSTMGLQADGTLLVGGGFGAFSGVEQPLVRLTTGGGLESAFAPRLQIGGSAATLALQTDGKVLLGGDFTEINGQAVHRLVRLQPGGALDAAFSAATGVLPTPVSALTLQPNGKILVGTAENVARYETSGSPDATFTPFVTGTGYFVNGITGLALQADGRVLVAGNLSGTANGTPVNGLARLTTTGAVDPSFVRLVNDPVLGASAGADAVLVQADGRIVVSSRFRPAPQTSTYRVVRYESSGALDASFNNTATYNFTTTTAAGRVFALAQQADGKLLVGGSFGQIDGATRYNVARLTAAGTVDPSFTAPVAMSGSVRALTIQPNGRVLLGGNFTLASSPGRSNLARVLDNGLVDATFGATANPNGQVRTLAVQPDGAILLAGPFTTVAGQARLGVARITAANVLSVAAPAAVAARTAVWPVPAHGQLHVAPDFSAQPRSLTLLDATGRAVRTRPVAGTTEQTLDLDALPTGLYLLQVHYAAGTVTRRIAVE
ncbi:T9SS type A sorting domain-containing protein [Hymenobacter convexus]|uniref:T9SS type A sorting domain-containing protein n=1 Tax=Hymenobacter sp. CA1UV-4 TaxID=3063782 RepID=UPI00271348B7|nr:T9SS type A sorting domain-containing protein [Hymenobacter sp. CA1UV-4]MDO7853724.1 T9SS type A sorting domain-containing protein [Hymenobacter sp. CA1UV-4]